MPYNWSTSVRLVEFNFSPNDERKGTSGHSGWQQTCDGDEDKEDFFRCRRDSNSGYFTSNTIWIGIIHPFLVNL